MNTTTPSVVEFAVARLNGQPAIPQFVVMTAAAPKPNNCMGIYKRVAVVETNRIHMPKQINPRHKAVRRIVATWEMCNVGKTDRCAFRRALAQANQIAAQANQIAAQANQAM